MDRLGFRMFLLIFIGDLKVYGISALQAGAVAELTRGGISGAGGERSGRPFCSLPSTSTVQPGPWSTAPSSCPQPPAPAERAATAGRGGRGEHPRCGAQRPFPSSEGSLATWGFPLGVVFCRFVNDTVRFLKLFSEKKSLSLEIH